MVSFFILTAPEMQIDFALDRHFSLLFWGERVRGNECLRNEQ
jgi:hypothetical protein